MNTLVYDACLLGGTALAATGAGLTFGVGVGLMVAGGLAIGLTYASALILGFSRGGAR